MNNIPKSKKFRVTYIETVESEIEFEHPITDIEAAYLFMEEDFYDKLDNATVVNQELLEIEPVDWTN